MSALRLVRIDPDRNMARFYRLDVQPTLFGEWALIREWGRIGAGGKTRSLPYPTRGEADLALARLFKEKAQRGYRAS